MSSDESDSKNTRSPTLTTKSCWLPGAALPRPLSALGSLGFLAQPAAASASAKKADELRGADDSHNIRHSGASIVASLLDRLLV